MINRIMNEEQLKQQEQMDADVYGSTRGMFEILLDQMVAEAMNGQNTAVKRKAVLDAYRSASQGAQNLMGQVRRAQNDIKVLEKSALDTVTVMAESMGKSASS